MANGSAPEAIATTTPASDRPSTKSPTFTWVSRMNSGAIVATAGSIRTPRTAIIRTSRPRNCSRENA